MLREYKSSPPLLPTAEENRGYLSRGSGAANLKTAGKCAAESVELSRSSVVTAPGFAP